MARPGLDENVKKGILTPTNVGALLNTSHTTIYNWLDSEKFPGAYKPPPRSRFTRGEWRIPGPALVAFLVANNMPVAEIVTECAVNYERIYGKPKIPGGQIQQPHLEKTPGT